MTDKTFKHLENNILFLRVIKMLAEETRTKYNESGGEESSKANM